MKWRSTGDIHTRWFPLLFQKLMEWFPQASCLVYAYENVCTLCLFHSHWRTSMLTWMLCERMWHYGLHRCAYKMQNRPAGDQKYVTQSGRWCWKPAKSCPWPVNRLCGLSLEFDLHAFTNCSQASYKYIWGSFVKWEDGDKQPLTKVYQELDKAIPPCQKKDIFLYLCLCVGVLRVSAASLWLTTLI